MQNGVATMEINVEIFFLGDGGMRRMSYTIKTWTTICSNNSTSGYLSKRTGIWISKNYQHSHIHYSITDNSQSTETT